MSVTRVSALPADGRLILTIPEVARQLGIGKRAAYLAAQEYLRTKGRSGLPAIQVGRRVLVPRARLLRWLDGELGPQERGA